MDNLKTLLLPAVDDFAKGYEDIDRRVFKHDDCPLIGAGEQIVVTIRREHKQTFVEPPVALVEGVPV